MNPEYPSGPEQQSAPVPQPETVPSAGPRSAHTAEEEAVRDVFERMSIPRALAKMALPAIIGQLIVLIYTMADTFFIGRTNDPFMVAGVSLLLPMFNISIPISSLFGIGGGTLISRLLGAGEEKAAGRVSAFSFWACVVTAAAFSAGVFFFMTPLLNALGASENTFLYAKQYALCVIVIGALPTMLSMTIASLLRSIGFSRQAGFGISMGGLINIGLDPLFMFVLLPKGYEIIGAGVATMLSNVIALGYFLIVLFRLRGRTSLRISPRTGLPEGKLVRSVFAVGVPAAVTTFLFDFDYMVLNRLMSGYGDIALAAIGIVLKTERLPLNAGVGLCQGMTPIIAYNYSSGNLVRMKKTFGFARLVGLVIGGVSIALYLLFAPAIFRFFIDDPETIALGSTFLRVRCLATPLMFLSFHMVHFFNAVGQGSRSLFLGVFRWLGFNIPMLFALNAFFGMYGLVWAQLCADVFTVTLSYLVFFRFLKKRTGGGFSAV